MERIKEPPQKPHFVIPAKAGIPFPLEGEGVPFVVMLHSRINEIYKIQSNDNEKLMPGALSGLVNLVNPVHFLFFKRA